VPQRRRLFVFDRSGSPHLLVIPSSQRPSKPMTDKISIQLLFPEAITL
jgi:hypothetical protein